MGIRLIVVEPGAAAPVEKEFTSSPVRLGRNELNDVTLSDPFASEWHGVIRFDDQAVYYFDLGSLNGSTLGGKRLVKNTSTTLRPDDVLFLGRVRLTAQRTARTVPPPRVHQTPATMTVAWGVRPEEATGPRRSRQQPATDPTLPRATGRSQAVVDTTAPQIDGRLVRVMQAFADAF